MHLQRPRLLHPRVRLAVPRLLLPSAAAKASTFAAPQQAAVAGHARTLWPQRARSAPSTAREREVRQAPRVSARVTEGVCSFASRHYQNLQLPFKNLNFLGELQHRKSFYIPRGCALWPACTLEGLHPSNLWHLGSCALKSLYWDENSSVKHSIQGVKPMQGLGAQLPSTTPQGAEGNPSVGTDACCCCSRRPPHTRAIGTYNHGVYRIHKISRNIPPIYLEYNLFNLHTST